MDGNICQLISLSTVSSRSSQITAWMDCASLTKSFFRGPLSRLTIVSIIWMQAHPPGSLVPLLCGSVLEELWDPAPILHEPALLFSDSTVLRSRFLL